MTFKEWFSKDTITTINPQKLSARNIFIEAEKGDTFALHIVDYTADILGNALADFACFSDPQGYILFGGLAQSGSFFSEKVKMAMEHNLLKVLQNKIVIRNSTLHDKNAAVLGTAASIFWHSLKN